MKTKFIFTAFLLLLVNGVRAQEQPRLPETDRIRLAEAFRIGAALGNRVWEDWDKAPFAVLLVTPEHEFLLRHPQPAQDFTLIGYDSLLQSNVHFRKRTQSPHFLATFPAVGGISTIVIGQAENTSAKTSTPWVVTMLHEHFHQLQDSQPDFYTAVAALNLSGGDQTGMWMLNYPFPYADPEVSRQFTALSTLLAEMIRTRKHNDFTGGFVAYLNARRKFEKMLSPDDYNYLSFQLWKEGVARYTEYRIARLAALEYQPSETFLALHDFKPFADLADELFENILRELTTFKLDEHRRGLFYPFGAAEALLLDSVNPKWQDRYFAEKFHLGKYFDSK